MAALSREEQLELVQAVRNGDERAFERLYLQVEPLLRRSLFRIVPQDDLDDVIQETMFRAHQKLAQFQEEASFSTWCMSIGINMALMRRRKLKRETQIIISSIDETVTNSDGVEHKVVELGYEDRTAEQNLAYRMVQQGLEAVTAEQRTAILMQLAGHSLDEISTALNRSVPATKSVLLRGKRALEDALSAPVADTRLCKCGCGESIPAKGWPYKAGHGKRVPKAAPELVEALV